MDCLIHFLAVGSDSIYVCSERTDIVGILVLHAVISDVRKELEMTTEQEATDSMAKMVDCVLDWF